ncbi:error-prone DNA polymerase [Pararhizobium mangrovi]|uniref:error-prone DNA polymerase n=1 Tax=Pararhizobium mangrovi TaxID=2590452 RepID=UPI001F345835|nr:error-prone DNA polymerase [Pararhizobium mangrovi]
MPKRAPGTLVPAYAELSCTSNFSFLRGASHPGELVIQAKAIGHAAIGIADRNTLAGVVRAYTQARKEGLHLLVGTRLETTDGFSCLCYPKDRAAYGRLCRLLTKGKMAAQKGECHFTFDDMLAFMEGQVIVALPPAEVEEASFCHRLGDLAKAVPDDLWIAMHRLYRGDEQRRSRRIAHLAGRLGLPLVAINDVHFHHPDRRPLQDVVTCIREKCTLEEAGFRLAANAERHLKPPEEMARLFAAYPEAIEATMQIVARCTFDLGSLVYTYPSEPVPPGTTAQAHLEHLARAGARRIYGDPVPDKVAKALEKEFALIEALNYPHYFLTVHDIVSYARSEGILCQGRGSAANSTVCYCLGVTALDPMQSSLLIERFLSRERKEPPDIDIDFEHKRREEVIQYVYGRYGRHRAALAATVISYRPRSAVREVGKVMGLSEDVTAALAGTVWGAWGKDIPDARIREVGLDPEDPHLKRTMELTKQLLGFPRHLSQHVGGFVLTDDALETMVPIGNGAMDKRTFIEWDKDDIDELKILKVDLLALGMLTCMAKGFALIKKHYGETYELRGLKQEDEVYAMLARADAIGVFQVESRAQLNMLPRLKPKRFYDLVIEVAIVRPGPIQGDMVHPYLRRRDELEKVDYPSPTRGPENELKAILSRTLGVPLFQEQAMQIAIDAAKFSAEEANELRKAMATFRQVGTIHTLEDKMVGRMVERGYDEEFSKRCFNQIKGFGEYGFPESHAASFALIVYASAWLKCYYPDVFCAALLNSQPMGFYAPAQIVGDARKHIEVRAVDLNHSFWDSTLEEAEGKYHAVRLGFRQVDGLSEAVMEAFSHCRAAHGPFATLEEARRIGGLTLATLEKLAAADSFRSLGLDRREGLWAVRGLMSDRQLPLFDTADADPAGADTPATLPTMPLSEHVVADYQTQRLSLKAHPMHFLRETYRARRIRSASDLEATRHDQRVAVAGVVLVRQQPGTAKGVVFITIEDETGSANIIVWRKVLEKYRKVVMGARVLMVRGRVQRSGAIIHVVAEELVDLSDDLAMLSEGEMPVPVSRADETRRQQREDPRGQPRRSDRAMEGANRARHPREVRIIPKSRDFH